MTSSRPLPDDVEVGLLVDGVTGGNFVRVDVEADYATEGRWSPCRPESAWHFNLHPEHMYDLHSAEPDVTWFEYGFASQYGNSNSGMNYVLQANRHWASRDSSGNIASKNGFYWMNAFHPEVQEFMTNLILSENGLKSF